MDTTMSIVNVKEQQKTEIKTGSTISKSALHYSHFVVSINGAKLQNT